MTMKLVRCVISSQEGGKLVNTMKDYDRVRALYFKKGLSISEISRRTGFHRSTVKKMIELEVLMVSILRLF